MTARPKALRAEYLNATDGVRLSWRVDNLAVVMDTWESVQVFRATAEEGTYSAVGSPVALVADTYEYTYTDAGDNEAKWYKVAFYESVGPTDGDKTDPVAGTGGGLYLTVQDLRNYGWSVTQISNANARANIAEAEAALEQLTGQRFVAEQKTVELDGNGSKILPMLEVVIQVDEIELLSGLSEIGEVITAVDVDSVAVSNRHLTQRLLRPDDRHAPALVYEFVSISPSIALDRWIEGTQNVKVAGWWGYTELEPWETAGTITDTRKPLSRGRTPPLVKRATMLLAARLMATPADPGGYAAAQRQWALTKNKMRDQEQNWAATAIQPGGITGDANVDMWIESFQAPTSVEFV